MDKELKKLREERDRLARQVAKDILYVKYNKNVLEIFQIYNKRNSANNH